MLFNILSIKNNNTFDFTVQLQQYYLWPSYFFPFSNYYLIFISAKKKKTSILLTTLRFIDDSH